VAGRGVLPELVELAGSPERVLTVADSDGARRHGVRFSRGDAGRALYALDEIGPLVEAGRFTVGVARAFPLADVARAQRASQDGHQRGKIVLVVD
jgi:NADPH:quinone reductase-like Zn-dependent oxidoreductase